MGLLDFFSQATSTDPMRGLLGAAYSDADIRAARTSEALRRMSQALLNPAPNAGGGIGGSFATLGTAVSNAGAGYREGPAYLQQAAAQEIQSREEKRKTAEEARKVAEDEKSARLDTDIINTLTPEELKSVAGNPQLALQLWEAKLKRQYDTTAGSGDWGVNPVRVMDANNNIFYRTFNKDGETKLTPEVPGTKPYGTLKLVETVGGMVPTINGQPVAPAVAGSDPAAIAAAKEHGKVTGQTEADTYYANVKFANNVTSDLTAIDKVAAGADKYAGMSPDKFINSATDLQGWYDWRTTLESVKATATAVKLDTVKLYPMSDSDKAFVTTMANKGLDEWRSPKDVKELVRILRKSNLERLQQIKAGTTLQMPDVDSLIKQFDVPAGVEPPKYKWERDPATGKMVKVPL